MDIEENEIIENMPKNTEAISKLDESKKKDKLFLIELVSKEPERLAYDKVLASMNKDTNFIMRVVQKNEDVIKYMPNSLKEDTEFLTDVVRTYPNTLNSVLKNCNVIRDSEGNITLDHEKIALENRLCEQYRMSRAVAEPYCNSQKFMSKAIMQDATMILLASETLKDNKEFVKVEALKNREVFNTVLDNLESFGDEGLKGVKEANTEYAIMDSKSDFEERLKSLKSGFLSKGYSEDDVEADKEVKKMMRHIKTLEKLEQMSPEKKDRYMRRAKFMIKDKAQFFEDACKNDDAIGNELKTRAEKREMANNQVSQKSIDDEIEL